MSHSLLNIRRSDVDFIPISRFHPKSVAWSQYGYFSIIKVSLRWQRFPYLVDKQSYKQTYTVARNTGDWNNTSGPRWLSIRCSCHNVSYCMTTPGADPGFWFGKGTGRGTEGRSPSGVQRQNPDGGLGAKPPEARRMSRYEAEKTTYGERKNKSIQTDITISYYYHPLIHSWFNVSSHFCFKIQNAVCGLQR